MKKKIHPKDQTKEIRDALFEFMQRNPERKREFDIKFKRVVTDDAEFGDEDGARYFEDYIKAGMCGSAVIDGQDVLDSLLISVLFMNKTNLRQYDSEAINDMWYQKIMDKATWVLPRLIFKRPAQGRIIIIDLERTKEAIMAEVEEIVTDALKEYKERWSAYKYKARSHGICTEYIFDFVGNKKKQRLKWLPIAPELREVWDLHGDAGQQPWQKTFRLIAKKVGRPLSTVKDQWRQAYEKIYGEKYTPEVKFTTEEKHEDAVRLCAKCNHSEKCYRGREHYPCREYLAIEGKKESFDVAELEDPKIAKSLYKERQADFDEKYNKFLDDFDKPKDERREDSDE